MTNREDALLSQLNFQPRGLVYRGDKIVANRMIQKGWVESLSAAGLTVYRITEKGREELKGCTFRAFELTDPWGG